MQSSIPPVPQPEPYNNAQADAQAARPLFVGIVILCGLLAAACVVAFNDHRAAQDAAAVHRTRLDLPAAQCPAPASGETLLISMRPGANGDFAVRCSTIHGRSL